MTILKLGIKTFTEEAASQTSALLMVSRLCTESGILDILPKATGMNHQKVHAVAIETLPWAIAILTGATAILLMVTAAALPF